ncbi:hypothetical protein FG379_000204 [Cryptosporidium bovis]|uniref:uncharacterized protein n=1 Tax=Cryptosporidium bovis TaxID=310047 RepID=UPI00351A4446|nr:hypothetical protein FG379_000204 [Cryptosporidium bovis]
MGKVKRRTKEKVAENTDSINFGSDTYGFVNDDSSGKKSINETENRYSEILGYYKRIKSAILDGELLDDEENCEILVERMVEDMKKKDIETLLLTDQRCSKTFELILSIGILSIRRLFDNVPDSKNEDKQENSIHLERLMNTLSKCVFILESVFREVENNVFSMYGSHITETALEEGILLQNYIGKMLNDKKLKGVRESLICERDRIRNIIVDSIKRLGEGPGWISVITDSSATHVGRIIMNICVGKIKMSIEAMEEYIMESIGRRNQGSKVRSNNKISFSSERYSTKDLLSLLCTFGEEDKTGLDDDCNTSNTISNQIYKALLLDMEGIISDAYGLPSLITLLRALNEASRKENKYLKILGRIITVIITNGQEVEEDIIGEIIEKSKLDTDKISRLLINCTNNWINCSLKSRLLEALLEIVPYDIITIWTSSHTCLISSLTSSDSIKGACDKERMIDKMLNSEYGHFVILNLLKSNVLRKEEFTLVLKSLDFSKLTCKKEFIDILIALIDSCRRFQCEYKYLTRKLWKSLEIETSEDYQYTFSCLIFLVKRSIFDSSKKDGSQGNCINQTKGYMNDTDNENKNDSGNFNSECEVFQSSEYKISSQGCMIISSLSKFPAETIHPLISGITYFITNFKNAMKSEIIETNYGTRMVENILSSTSTIPTSIKKKWIQSYIGDFLRLTLKGGVCNYALIAMFYASDHFYRKIIVEELLDEERGGGKDVIMSENFKIFKSLKIETFVKQDKNWYDINNKIDKTREMFKSIIDEKIETTDNNGDININNKRINKSEIKNKSFDSDDRSKDHDISDDIGMNSILQHIRSTNINKRVKR